MFPRNRILVAASVFVSLLMAGPVLADFSVLVGTSWDDVSLQEILDAEYGPGAIDVATDYEGASVGDADPPYWEDLGLDGILIREVAGYAIRNTLGWYEVGGGGLPTIDGLGDGIIFTGPMSPRQSVNVTFSGVTQFGFYLDPNGDLDGTGAPQGEYFFTDRFLNDIGPSGSALHEPTDGDPQVLIFNITHLRGGVHTVVLAWEDLDSGLELNPVWAANMTDNDFNDLVVEISAFSPVPNDATSWGRVKALYGDQ